LVFFQKDILAGLFTAQASLKILSAPLHQLFIQRLQAVNLRDRDQEVLSGKLHHAFYHSLFIGASNLSKVLFEQVVALQLEKTMAEFSSVGAQDLTDQDTLMIITDPPWYSPKELESTTMAFPEHFRANTLEYLHEHRIRVRQSHYEINHFTQMPTLLDQGIAKIHLCLTRAVEQRHVNFLVLLLDFPHCIFDLGISHPDSPPPGASQRCVWQYAAVCGKHLDPQGEFDGYDLQNAPSWAWKLAFDAGSLEARYEKGLSPKSSSELRSPVGSIFC
jgi:hypothetical protein